MEYRSLGRTGVQVSSLCLGCMNFGWRTEEDEAHGIIDRAIDAGVNFIDTANVYSRGTSEEIVGRALKKNGQRDHIVLATKVHGKMSDEDPNMVGNHRRHIKEQCEASLRRLGTDWIDLYQVHRPAADVPIDETLRALDDLVREGKVHYVGTSTFPSWQVVEALWVAKELGLNRVVTEQPPYHLLDRRIERELVPMCRTYGIGIIPWSPLAEGFLSGKYDRSQQRTTGRLKDSGKWNDRHFVDAAFDVVDECREIAEKHGDYTPAEVAIAWNAQQPGITAPIIGPRTGDQLQSALKAVELTLDKDDLDALDEVTMPGRAIVPYYGANWRAKFHSWV
jgi:aryl-alcohol dehydrogenase-like predicted oxidoreductase